MKKIKYEKEVFASWKACIKAGVSPDMPMPSVIAGKDEYEALKAKNKSILYEFQECMDVISGFIPPHTAFMVADRSGILLKKNT